MVTVQTVEPPTAGLVGLQIFVGVDVDSTLMYDSEPVSAQALWKALVFQHSVLTITGALALGVVTVKWTMID